MRASDDSAAPLVTVVICARDAGRYLREAVDSALAQTYENLEILVIDDGSSDDSFASIDTETDPRLRVLRHENRGKPASLNRALDEMNGEFYALLDADDRCSPERIAKQAQAMIDEPDLAAIFCGVELIIDERTIAPRFRAKGVDECRRDLEALHQPGHDPSGMFRTSLARKLRYRDDYRARTDAGEVLEDQPPLQIGFAGYDLILRLADIAPRMRVLGECLYQYRIQMASITRSRPEARIRAVYEIQRSACERRGLPAPPEPKRPARYRNRDLDNNIAAHFIESALDLRRAGRIVEAIRVGFYCASLRPFDLHYAKPLVYALLPSGLTTRLRAWSAGRLERVGTQTG